MENQTGKVYAALAKARDEFSRMELQKSGKNNYAGYTYFELGDFLPVAQRLFAKHNLVGVVSFAKEMAFLRIVHTEDGSYAEITSPMSSAALKGCHEVQNLGAVQTYLRRYLWSAALELVEHDAVDAAPPPVAKKPKPEPNPEEPEHIKADREQAKARAAMGFDESLAWAQANGGAAKYFARLADKANTQLQLDALNMSMSKEDQKLHREAYQARLKDIKEVGF